MNIQDKHINDRIKAEELKKFNILAYDDDNLYPQKIREIINGSSTAKSCTDRLTAFLVGKGLTNKVLESYVINSENDTIYNVLVSCFKDYAKFNGFAVWRKINVNSKTVEMYHVPFDWVRKVYSKDKDNFTAKYCIYNNWDAKNGKIDKDDFQYAWAYNENEDVIIDQILEDGSLDIYSGQLLYYSADGDNYPLAWIDAIQEDCIVDNQMKVFNYKNVTTNFMASHIAMFGEEPEDPTKADISKSLKELQGAENASKIIALYGVNKDTFDLRKIDIQNHDKLFEATNATTKQNIREMFGQDLPFFKGGLTASDISGEAIKTTYAFYNALTEMHRKAVTDIFSKLLKTWYLPIVSDIEIDKLTFEI